MLQWKHTKKTVAQNETMSIICELTERNNLFIYGVENVTSQQNRIRSYVCTCTYKHNRFPCDAFSFRCKMKKNHNVAVFDVFVLLCESMEVCEKVSNHQ